MINEEYSLNRRKWQQIINIQGQSCRTTNLCTTVIQVSRVTWQSNKDELALVNQEVEEKSENINEMIEELKGVQTWLPRAGKNSMRHGKRIQYTSKTTGN